VWSAKAHEAKNVFRCETHFHKWGKVQGMKPNDSQVHSHFGSCKCLKPWLERQTNTKLGPQNTIRKVLKRRCLRCPHIVHLNLIFMNYDQKKKRESNWKFDSRPQIPWKKRSNEVRLGQTIQHWKDIFKGYTISPSNFQNKFDLKNIWTSKILGQRKSQFWDSHLGVLRKSDIWM